MKNKLSAQILEKYFNGTCTEEEKVEIYSWYQSFEFDQDDISNLSNEEQQLFKSLMWDNISHQIKDTVDTEKPERDIEIKHVNRFKQLIYLVTAIAASMLVFIYVINREHPPGQTKTNIDNNRLSFTNTSSTIKRIVLSDGSSVWVSPKSTLVYLKAFEKQRRQVSLNGEAFFEVTKDHKRPFSIYTGKVVTKVWGTSFRISAYEGDRSTKVDVVTGKVSVTVAGDSIGSKLDNSEGIMLLPNQEAVYDKQANYLKKNIGIKDNEIGMWKRANLSFNNTPIKTVFAELNKSFNVNISSSDDNINADFLKADFTNENLATVLEILKRTLNVTYTVNGNNFVIETNQLEQHQ